MSNEVHNPGPECRDDQRRAILQLHPFLNGIDYVEYELRPTGGPDPDQHFLVIHFHKPLSQELANAGPDEAYGLIAQPELIQILGGSRIVGIKVVAVQRVGDELEIEVTRRGDFSIYTLTLGFARQSDGSWQHLIANLDRWFSVAPVNFRAECPVDFDCLPEAYCAPEELKEPLLDFLAKDYASFRRLLLDLIAQRNPNWIERNPADLGIVLVELLAHTGDRLSYAQDVIANEAYLDTARLRVSARRHARLVDYRMHDGRNAWTPVHVETAAAGTLPLGTKVLTRIAAPLRHQSQRPPTVIPESDLTGDAFDTDPALAAARVFETAFDLVAHPENNTIYIHDGGDLECCLPCGIRSAELYGLTALGNGLHRAIRPVLEPGDFLLLEEVKGPETGLIADADPDHRHLVRIKTVEPLSDPLYRDELRVDERGEPRLQEWRQGDDVLPTLRATWCREDALPEPLCLSASPPGEDPLVNITVAHGNIVLADHGRTVQEKIDPGEPVPGIDESARPYTLVLQDGPLTMQCPPAAVEYQTGATGPILLSTARHDLRCDVAEAVAAIDLAVIFSTGTVPFIPVPDLLDSTPTAAHFVVEIEDRGSATLRFGDDEYGRRPTGASAFHATYRIGTGRDGNVGAEALHHVVQPAAAAGWPEVTAVRNPLPAEGGDDREGIEEVRHRAPAAFHAEQFRAVTEDDYAAAALKSQGVAGAVATYRWTGSWYTVFVGIDPEDSDDLITEPGGRARLRPSFAHRIRAHLTQYKLAGYDLSIRSAEYVPLDLELVLCVAADHFRGDVVRAVLRALSNRVNPDGTRGFFHPDNLTFAQPVYLSALYAAVEAVEGVDSLVVRRFRRFGRRPSDELQSGILVLGDWEIARLDYDPNFMERGVLRIEAMGGK